VESATAPPRFSTATAGIDTAREASAFGAVPCPAAGVAVKVLPAVFAGIQVVVVSAFVVVVKLVTDAVLAYAVPTYPGVGTVRSYVSAFVAAASIEEIVQRR